MASQKMLSKSSLLLTTACFLVASYSYGSKSINAPDGTITITTPSMRIQIETIQTELGKLAQNSATELNLDIKERDSFEQDNVVPSLDNTAVASTSSRIPVNELQNHATTKYKNNDVRIEIMTPAIQKWISIRVQELSFMLSDLFDEMQERNRKPGVVLAGHLLFLNAYNDLYKISKAQLPNLRWLDQKLVAFDEYISNSLEYINDWIDWADEALSKIEASEPNKFSAKSQWLSLVWALKRLKKEQTVSRDINDKIIGALQKLVKYTSRSDWLKSSIIGQRKPEQLIYYREGIERIVSKTFPLEAQYSRYHNKL